jgi:hypothetical protein
VGSFRKHLDIATEKLDVLVTAYQNGQHTVVGDLGTKIVEQLIEADAARTGKHFGTHPDRHDHANREYPAYVNTAMKRVWFAYGDLLGEIGGRKLSRGCVLIPLSARTRLLRFFKKYSVGSEEIAVWR